MAISNAASGFRPGVCTSTTRPTNPFNGQVIYETDTKQTLVWQGTAWVMLTDADTPPGLELIKEQTIGTTVSSVTVSNVFSSTYDNYKIIVNSNSASATNNITLQFSGATGNTYYTNLMYWAWASATLNGYGPSVTDRVVVGQAYVGEPWVFSLELLNPNLARRTYGFVSEVGANNGGVGQIMENSTTQHTGFTVFASSGTITGGTIRVYGYRNTI